MNIKKTLLLTAVLLGLQACAPSAYNIDKPEPSTISYANPAESQESLHLIDSRPELEKTFSYGVLKAELLDNKTPVEPIEFLQKHTQAELKARNINAQLAAQGKNIHINKFVVRNHRTNAYTPFITFTMLSADIMSDEGSKRIALFIKRGKTPVWSFDEIIEPTFNQPLDLAIKEFVAKLNNHLFHQAMTDEEVQALIARINNADDADTAYQDVYQLGFSNNPLALDTLLELTNNDDEYIRLAAISGLGTIKAESSLERLKEIYATADIWQDKAMALKSIGDIGTDEARNFLVVASNELQSANDKERLWSQEVIDLYLK
ncbi:HEAT repeat domain-containing protein [Kangiella sp. M94]